MSGSQKMLKTFSKHSNSSFLKKEKEWQTKKYFALIGQQWIWLIHSLSMSLWSKIEIFMRKRFQKFQVEILIFSKVNSFIRDILAGNNDEKIEPGIVLMFHLSGIKWIHRFSLVNKSEFRNLLTVSGSVRALDRSNENNYSHFKEKATHFLHYSYISTINSND